MAFQAQTAGRGVGQLLSSRAGRGEAYFVGVPTGPCLNFPVLCSFYFYKISKVRLETNNYITKRIFKSRDRGDKCSCYFLLRGRSLCLWLTEFFAVQFQRGGDYGGKVLWLLSGYWPGLSSSGGTMAMPGRWPSGDENRCVSDDTNLSV